MGSGVNYFPHRLDKEEHSVISVDTENVRNKSCLGWRRKPRIQNVKRRCECKQGFPPTLLPLAYSSRTTPDQHCALLS